MRVGVTGSTGFIGTALTKALRQRGDEVVRFVRPESRSIEGKVIRWNPTTGHVDDGDLRVVGGFDAVVNLAGTGVADRRWSEARKNAILNSRVASTKLLVTALGAMTNGTPRVASGSAIGIYGAHRDAVLAEDAAIGDDFLASVCQAWEEEARPFSLRGTSVSLLRTGIVMDEGGGVLKRQLPLFRLGLGGVLGTGQQWQSVISLADQIGAILWVLDHGVDGPINLVSPTPITNREFTHALARAVRRPAMLRVPSAMLRIVLGSELAMEAVLASQRVVPTTLLESGFTFRDPDIGSILSSALAR